MQRTRIVGLLVAALLVAAAAAGCSSSSKSASSNSSTTTTAKASSSNNSSNDDSASSKLKDVAGAVGLSTSECAQAATAYGKILASASTALDPSEKTNTSELNAEYDALGAKIPSSLKDDYQTVGDAYKKFADDYSHASLSDPSSYQKAAGDLDTSDVKTAEANIEKYFTNKCKD